MSVVMLKGVVRGGRVEVAEPINLPDGSEVMITGCVDAPGAEEDRPMTPQEIADTLTAMAKIEPFEMTEEERAAAAAWEKKINDYTIANMDKGIEEVFR